jgi:hypothetical protein
VFLGFASFAQMEPEITHYIFHNLDRDLATPEMGINVIGAWQVEKFRERVQAFVREIASSHDDRWIFCIDLFTCVYGLPHDPLIDQYA